MAANTDKILESIEKIPSMSPNALKVVEVCNSMTSSANEVNRVISIDPVITAKVLQLVNSAYFSMPEKVTSVVKAIVILGLNTIKNLALSTAVLQNLSGSKKSTLFDMTEFWKHSLGCAVGAKIIARQINEPADMLEEYFVCGLLHDIGKVVMNQMMSDEYDAILETAKTNNRPLIIEEAWSMGMTHAEVGAKIAEKWHFPDTLKECIEFHHKVEKCQQSTQKIAAVVNISDYLCKLNHIGFSGNYQTAPVKPSIMAIAGVSQADFPEFAEKIRKNVEKAADFLQVLSK